MANELDALFGEPEAAPTEPAKIEPQAQPEAGQGRDEQGRFAPKETKAETPAAPVAEVPKPAELKVEPPKTEEKDPFFVGMLNEREKRQKLTREIADLRAAQQQKPQHIPSIKDDPDGWAAHQEGVIARRLFEQRVDDSEYTAREKHGDAVVDAALQFGFDQLNSVPGFAQQQASQRYPIDWLIKQHKRHELMAQIGDDDAAQKAFIERRARELGLIPNPSPAAPAAVQPQPTPSTTAPLPRRSQASEPSAGGPQTPVLKTEAETFKDAFA